jgi:hypothetical protein
MSDLPAVLGRVTPGILCGCDNDVRVSREEGWVQVVREEGKCCGDDFVTPVRCFSSGVAFGQVRFLVLEPRALEAVGDLGLEPRTFSV